VRAPILLILPWMLVAAALAQAKPDFSGTWQLDVTRSPGVAPGRSDTWIVTQAADTLTLVDQWSRAGARVYRLDGTPTEEVDLLTGRWVYHAIWIGDRLVIASEGERPGTASTETWYLDQEGRLVIEWQRNPGPRGRPLLVHRYTRVVGDAGGTVQPD